MAISQYCSFGDIEDSKEYILFDIWCEIKGKNIDVTKFGYEWMAWVMFDYWKIRYYDIFWHKMVFFIMARLLFVDDNEI